MYLESLADWPEHFDRKADANGYPKDLNTYVRASPSYYINGQTNHMALIGTFADKRGVIVVFLFLWQRTD